MDVLSKGKRIFTQSYNPMCVVVGRKVSTNQIVYSFYSSPNEMSAADMVAYRNAAARKFRSLCR